MVKQTFLQARAQTRCTRATSASAQTQNSRNTTSDISAKSLHWPWLSSAQPTMHRKSNKAYADPRASTAARRRCIAIAVEEMVKQTFLQARAQPRCTRATSASAQTPNFWLSSAQPTTHRTSGKACADPRASTASAFALAPLSRPRALQPPALESALWSTSPGCAHASAVSAP